MRQTLNSLASELRIREECMHSQDSSAEPSEAARSNLQQLPAELLAEIGERYLDAAVWHCCKLGEVSPQMGAVFMDDSLWEKFLTRRFSQASQHPKRRFRSGGSSESLEMSPRQTTASGGVVVSAGGVKKRCCYSPSPSSTTARSRSGSPGVSEGPTPNSSPSLRAAYAKLHELEARFSGGQYSAREVLRKPQEGAAILDLHLSSGYHEDATSAFAALRNGTLVKFSLEDEEGFCRSGPDSGAPAPARPVVEFCPPTDRTGCGGPTLCCLPISASVEPCSEDAPFVLAGYAMGGICGWDVSEGTSYCPLSWENAHAQRVTALTRLGNSDLVSAGSDGILKAWALDGDRFGQIQRSFLGHRGPVVSVSASPFDPNLMLSGSHDRCIRLWDARVAGEAVAMWSQQDWVTCVDFHPANSNHLFSSDKAVHLWDLRMVPDRSGSLGDGATNIYTQSHISESHRHRKLVSRFRVDFLRLVSCSLDGSVKVSSLENPDQSMVYPLSAEPAGRSPEATLRTSTDYVLSIDFDTTRLVVGGVDGGVDIYDFSCPDHFKKVQQVESQGSMSPTTSPKTPLVSLEEALAVARLGPGRCRTESDLMLPPAMVDVDMMMVMEEF